MHVHRDSTLDLDHQADPYDPAALDDGREAEATDPGWLARADADRDAAHRAELREMARAAGMTPDAIARVLPEPDACPHCGHDADHILATDGCYMCDDAAQLGQHAPCLSIEALHRLEAIAESTYLAGE